MSNVQFMENSALPFVKAFFDENKKEFTDLSDEIWNLAEVKFTEFKSAEALKNVLKKYGFTIKENLVEDLPTAFTAEWSNGDGPVIGTIGEYDALPNLGNELVPYKKPTGKNGHGCGHNLLGTGSLAAAVAASLAMKKFDIKGTVKYFGCPAEENGGGKLFMVREGVFDGLDAVVRWHPITATFVSMSPSLCIYSIKYRFHGKSAHAGVTPHLGRSALDAAILMDVGVNYLREHIPTNVRVHSIITNGGSSPNTVPDFAEIYYGIRAPHRSDVDEVVARMEKIARGMAMATETTVDIKIVSAYSETLPNQALCDRMLINLNRVGAPEFTPDEKVFAAEMNKDVSADQKIKDLRRYGINDPDAGNTDLYDRIGQDLGVGTITPYSTDSGDVSWQAPMCQMFAAAQPVGSTNHSWQQVVCAGMSIGHKGMLCAAETIAMTMLDILTDPELLEAAKNEFNKKLKASPYTCPMPKDIKPRDLQ